MDGRRANQGAEMTQIVLNLDDILSSHDERVFSAFQSTAAANTLFGSINSIFNYREVSEILLGISSVINWSFSELIYTDRYNYDDVIKTGFLQDVAFTKSAGNNTGCSNFTASGLILVRPDIADGNGIYQLPAFDRIDVTASSPYDFTVGSVTDSFDLACFSESAPRFVDFYVSSIEGTSFAAAKVAGLITQIKEDYPAYTLNHVRTVLERNSNLIEFERPLSYTTESENVVFIAQVLDPNNFDTRHRIDMQTKVDGLYEVLFGRNPDKVGLEWWLENIKANQWSVSEVIDRFLDSTEAVWYSSDQAESSSKAPLIERVQAMYHIGLSREPTLEETTNLLDRYATIGENWKQMMVDFTGMYDINKDFLSW
jgi:hypothetical protein